MIYAGLSPLILSRCPGRGAVADCARPDTLEDAHEGLDPIDPGRVSGRDVAGRLRGTPLRGYCRTDPRDRGRGTGRIYVYQLADGAIAAEPAIVIDGRKVGRSKPGRFFFVDRPAGTHTVATATDKKAGKAALDVRVDAGQTRYVRTEVVGGVQALRLEDDADKAQQDMSGLRYWGAGWRDREKLRY